MKVPETAFIVEYVISYNLLHVRVNSLYFHINHTEKVRDKQRTNIPFQAVNIPKE